MAWTFVTSRLRPNTVVLWLLIVAYCQGYDRPYCQSPNASCSSQLNLTEEDACVIKSTKICRLTPLTNSPELLIREHDSPFRVIVQPYIFVNRTLGTWNSSINITLETSDKAEIKGFHLLIQQETNSNKTAPYNSCRIFDFSKGAEIIPIENISLFYDCYVNMDFQQNLIYDLIVRAVPTYQELHYRLKVSSVIEAKRNNCSLDLLVMINSLALSSNIVEFKFSKAPTRFNIKEYKVYLETGHHGKEYEMTISTTDNENLSGVIPDVPAGLYNLVIDPVLSEKTLCSSLNRTHLHFEIQENERIANQNYWIYALVLVLFLLSVAFLGLLLFKFRQSECCPQEPVRRKPKVLLIYSYDCKLHFNVVLKFKEYLEKYCDIEVYMDCTHQTDKEHITDWFSRMPEMNFVVIIMSRGVYHKVELRNTPPLQSDEENKWGDRFTPTYNYFCQVKLATPASNGQTCNITKVFFEYTNRRSYTPKPLRGGQTFDLFSQLNNFLCQIHEEPYRSFPIKIYPKMPGSDITSNDMGRELCEAVQEMMEYQKNEPKWFDRLTSPTANIDPIVEERAAPFLNAAVRYVNEERRSSQESSRSLHVMLPEEVVPAERRELLSDEDTA